MTNLTQKEIAVLTAFSGVFDYETAEQQKADNAALSDVKELALIAEMTEKSVKGVVGSLTKKGIFCETMGGEKGDVPHIGITDEGIDLAYALNAKGDEPEAPAETQEAPAAPKAEDDVEAITGHLRDALAAEGATKCSALRAIAASCSAPRASFIAAAEAVGINRGTAARQWQEGRSDDAPSAMPDIDKEALVSAILEQLAHDEIAHRYVEALGKGAMKDLVKELGL